MDRERNLFQKIVLIILLVMTLLFTGVLVHNRSKTGIAFDGKLLQLQHFLTARDAKPADFYYSTHYLGCTALVVATFVGYFIAVTSAA